MADYVTITINVIGYNEKGLIGFMTGGEHLTYLDLPSDDEDFKDLPYISEEDVEAVNSRKE